jgi:hypothetical protein
VEDPDEPEGGTPGVLPLTGTIVRSRPEAWFCSRPELSFRSHRNKFTWKQFTGILFLFRRQANEPEEDDDFQSAAGKTG